MLEAYALKASKLPRVASLRLVANTDALDVDILGQLLGNLGQNRRKGVLGLYRQPELAVFANKLVRISKISPALGIKTYPQYHDRNAMNFVVEWIKVMQVVGCREEVWEGSATGRNK